MKNCPIVKAALLTTLVLFVLSGCINKDAEETAKKAALYDATQRNSEENAQKAALYDSLQVSVTKQQKLEECMLKAASDSRDFRKHEMNRLGCDRYAKDGFGPADVISGCNAVANFSKQDQLEAEERCVKLYK